MYRELFALLDSRVLVLTANQRLARHLQQGYNRYQQQQGLTVWPNVAIFALNLWLNQQWQQNFSTHEVLLNDHEEIMLWQDIIQNNPGSDLLLQINSTAQLAKQAWQTLNLWQVDFSMLDAGHNQDVAKFIEWATSFAAYKQKKQLISSAELTHACITLLKAKQLTLPPKIIIVGFDDLPPVTTKLFQQFSECSECIYFEPSLTPESLARIECKDEEHEIQMMATWAKKNHNPANPHKIGCIVPKLSELRDKITTIFTDVFCPTNIIPGQAQQVVPYNISAGIPFHHLPMIKVALLALQTFTSNPQRDHLQTILLSPYINYADTDRCLGAMVARTLYAYSNNNLNHEKISTVIAEQVHEFPQSSLLKRWQATLQLSTQPQQQSLQQWVSYFTTLLETFGWPGQRHLNSHDYQVMQRWQQLQLALRQLDRLFAPVTQNKALSMLHDLCQNTIFQAQNADQPIQILGVLEAGGYQFEQIWLMGLDDETWPGKAQPNPFIPTQLQRQQGMPHASAQRELRICQHMQHRLFNSARLVIVSSAQQQGDKTLSPSPLIKGLEKIEPASLALHLPTTALAINALETLDNDNAPALMPQERIQGGSWILQEQARCPFRAFANIRLRALPIDEAEIGLSAKQRGIFCHQALDLLWRKIKTQKNLQLYTPAELQAVIADCIHEITKSNAYGHNHYLLIEQKRLTKVLLHWLSMEAQRPPFKVIERETKRHISIGKLAMRIQIDRIDELENGQTFIIDYKTSKQNSLYDWLGQRLLQPQLPIYCLYGNENAIGIAYAEVNLGNPQFKGIIDHEQHFSKVNQPHLSFNEPYSWQELKQHWQQALEALSENFCQGKAEVHPQNPQICDSCDLQSLCRIGDST